ncbi:amphi-Trp domain-containing protein [Candidatus Desulforudis audaxviator]|uniref:Rieske (2Fe-2S) domain protein n=1 Tax=Desulforudis audaxviator (strain MP104C) TaxID=477974 RepID=B1I6L5_DESAP|nr:amphi-Trp domain-containing protein [Candidatus Desulforudis audaxviator]ACA60644.1 Rieske (2Fe-2S) domain protein [Candidatus Desulforudis audaxviator MP104C]AZK60727.1 Rieske (2Fe-2S) domain-containing protein [Candidatus Desulforudis audaxviator]
MKIRKDLALSRSEAARFLKALAAEIEEKGRLDLNGLDVPLPALFKVELEYKDKPDKKKLEIEFKWPVESLSVSVVRNKDSVTERIRIVSHGSLPVGKAVGFVYRGRESLLIHLAPGEYKAYHRRCPHKGEPLSWYEPTREIHCEAHGAVFDAATGAVLKGPVREGLRPIRLEVTDEGIFAAE